MMFKSCAESSVKTMNGTLEVEEKRLIRVTSNRIECHLVPRKCLDQHLSLMNLALQDMKVQAIRGDEPEIL